MVLTHYFIVEGPSCLLFVFQGHHSVGLMWWMLAREVLRMRGTISREHPWDVMPDLYFYRDPEEVRQACASDRFLVYLWWWLTDWLGQAIYCMYTVEQWKDCAYARGDIINVLLYWFEKSICGGPVWYCGGPPQIHEWETLYYSQLPTYSIMSWVYLSISRCFVVSVAD